MKHQDLIKQNNLRQLREAKKISRSMLAMACTSDVSQIRKYEQGKCMPNYWVLRKIARFLGVSIDEIYPCVVELDKRLDRVKEIVLNMTAVKVDG